MILSDWLITRDCKEDCINGFKTGEKVLPRGMPWGVEDLSVEDRFAKAINAGVDQFGGVVDSSILVNAIKHKKVSEKRLDASVLRILNQKFNIGLFENPYVDAQKADEIVGNKQFATLANTAQFKSLVLLKTIMFCHSRQVSKYGCTVFIKTLQSNTDFRSLSSYKMPILHF